MAFVSMQGLAACRGEDAVGAFGRPFSPFGAVLSPVRMAAAAMWVVTEGGNTGRA